MCTTTPDYEHMTWWVVGLGVRLWICRVDWVMCMEDDLRCSLFCCPRPLDISCLQQQIRSGCYLSFAFLQVHNKLVLIYLWSLDRNVPLKLGLMKHSLTMARACLADITSEEDRAVRLGRYSAAATIGFAIGPTLGGHLMASYGFKVAACTTSALFLLNFVLSWWLIHPTQGSHSQLSKRRHAGWVQTFTFIRSKTWSKVSHLVVQRFFIINSILIVRRSMYHVLRSQFGTSPLVISYIASFQQMISVAAALSIGKISTFYSDNERLRLHACILMTMAIVGALFATHLWIFVAVLVPFGAMASLQRIAGTQLCLQLTSPEEKGEVLGIGQSVWSLTRILGPQMSGLAMDYSHSMPQVIAVAFAIIGTGHIYTFNVSKHDSDKKTD